MSLIVGYDSDNPAAAQAALAAANEIPNEYCFYRLFHYISSIGNRMYINASNLIVPATKLKSHCYEDMFYDARTSSYAYGLQQAPTFLATDFVDKDGNDVSSSFAGLCNGCQNFSSIHVNFQHCYAAGESNLTNWLKNCGTKRTIYAPEAFRTCANNNSGNTDAVWNGWTKTEWSKDVGPSTHTVTLAVDGTDSYGTLTAASIADVPHGATITVSSNTITINGTTVTATKTSDGGGYNYAFAGWYNGASQLTGNSNTVDDDMTITAHFTRAVNTYYVSFDPDDGSGEMTDQTFTYGVAQNLKANTFTGPAVTVTYNYNGATGGNSPASETVNASFYMWTDGSDVNFYEDEESVSNLTATNGATVALTAIWDFDQEVTLPSPTKTGYTFVQWEYGEAPIILIAGGAGAEFTPDEDVTLNAHWNAINYTITYNGLNDASNSNPASYTIESSTIVLANPGTRTGYTFTGWTDDDNSNAAVTQIAAGSTGNRHFTANWSLNTYTVTIVSNNAEYGTVSPASVASVPYGTTITTSTNTISVNGTTVTATPTASTAEYTYAFSSWTNGTATVTGALTVTANFSRTTNTYTVTWKNGEDVLETDESVAYGTTPTYNGSTPTKAADAQYTYTFNSWTPEVAAVTGNATYTATFTGTPKNYTLTWTTDGDALTGDYTTGTVAYGTAIEAPNTPTKTGYSFTGWRSSISGTVETPSTMPAQNLTYTATWEIAFSGIILWDNKDDDYYDAFKANDGTTADVLYPRQFKQGNWSTLCLPFDVNRGTMMSQKLNGSVYEFKYATGDATVGDNVMLYFAKANTMEAGKCYIVNANSTLAAKTSFTFSNVTFDLTNDLEEHLTSASAYDNLPETKTQGTIGLVGTLRKGTLIGEATGNKYMGLKNNKIWYPNPSVGNVILAYRGLFRSTEALGASRVRIVVEGETVTELEVVNGELKEAAEARKFVQDGILYIERDGVIYNAQGQRVE